jgi:hypothetical protein
VRQLSFVKENKHVYIYKFMCEWLRTKLEFRVKKVHRCAHNQGQCFFHFYYSKKDISRMLHFIFLFFLLYSSVKIGQVYSNQNSKYEKWTYVNDQRLVSFFIHLYRRRLLISFFFDNWLQIKWRIGEESKCLRQKLNQFFCFIFLLSIQDIHRWSVCEHLSS